MPNLEITVEQKRFLSSLFETLSSPIWEAENIHNAIHETSENEEIQMKTAFKTIYQILLGKENGPRAGYFLSNLDKDFVLNRFEEAIK